MKTVEIQSPLGMNVTSPNPRLIVNEIHSIPCFNCIGGVVKNWLGISKVCSVCNGSGISGEFIMTRVY